MRSDRGSRRARLALLALVVVVFIAIVSTMAGMGVVGAGPASSPVAADRTSLAAESSVVELAEPRRAPAGTNDAASGELPSADANAEAAARRRRDETRERILDALARSRSDGVPANEDDAAERPRATSGGLRDRIGGRDALVAALNDDFMPLADECLEAARERDPSLEGMLAISLDVIADEEHGAIVESVEFPENNEVHDALLHECIRETSLSTILPPPPEGGREGFLLTLPIEP